ncbi:glycoside hydrolase family 43 protein [Dysgonomonas sp. 37-18]|nr:glycoside hydrolase family 43 protein [Dysgonomonas sp. 37-18]OJX62505.1 MAG: carbohydrate-binding protein [Dysgonomonas sp. 37-18]
MNKKRIIRLCLLLILINLPLFNLKAQNPIIQTMYTADPAPMVYNDTLFLYVGHDEKDAPPNGYLMRDYQLFSTIDMVNWTAHKTPLRTSDFIWSVGDASAAQCIYRNGKFYWYISSMNKFFPGVAVGVASSDSPYGPFKDTLGKALVTNDMTRHAKHAWDDLDPSVFIDDDGQAYLYWGNGVCYWAKLNNDMISLDGDITALDAKDKSIFGPGFTEAPWVYKRQGLYYMIYASGFPESLHYTVSKNPTGPWEYKGCVMPLEGGSNTNHPGIIDYKGNSYFFYHNDALPGGHSYCRSVCVEQFSYNEDGSLPEMKMTKEGIMKGVNKLNPYKRTEAETMAWSEGISIEENEKIGVYVTSIHNGDYIKVRDVDFGNKGASRFSASVSSRYHGGTIEIRLDNIDGQLVGTLHAPYTGEWDNWSLVETAVKNTKDIHDVYFVFKGKEPHSLFNFDYWMFGE